jgi:hypothetical protein
MCRDQGGEGVEEHVEFVRYNDGTKYIAASGDNQQQRATKENRVISA